MRILIAEYDFNSRNSMLKFLSKYGECDVTVDGLEVLEAFTLALEDGEEYDLISLDINIPELDGYQVLEQIRQKEEELCIPEERRAKIIMTAAHGQRRNVKKAFELGCTAYACKPINKIKFWNALRKLDLI